MVSKPTPAAMRTRERLTAVIAPSDAAFLTVSSYKSSRGPRLLMSEVDNVRSDIFLMNVLWG